MGPHGGQDFGQPLGTVAEGELAAVPQQATGAGTDVGEGAGALVPGGGLVWLPIYLFTLVAAYKFGLAAGLLTALLSPIANNLGFGMPPAAMLPVILCKSVLLAVAASTIARRVGRVTLLGVAAAVVAYQAAGTLAEWAITGSLAVALQDIRIGWPGLLLQVFGGCLIMNMIGKKAN